MTIRVAHVVNSTFGTVFSGQTHYLFSLLSGWKEKEVSLDLYGTPIKPLNMNAGDRAYQLPEGSLWSANNKTQSRWDRLRWSLELLWMLVRRRKEYDIVHFHALGWGVFLSPLVLHPLGKKIVFTMSLYGNDNPSYILQRPRGRFQVNLLRRFDGFIGLSPALVKDAIANGFRNVTCLANFLAVPQLDQELDAAEIQKIKAQSRAKLGIAPDAQVLLFVGSIIYRKGVDVLVDAFIDLARQYPKMVLLLAGPQSEAESNSVDEHFVDRLKENIRINALQDRVFWLGIVKDQTTLVDSYRTADIFVFPTRNEGSPNVLAEAMSASLPVITSSLPGITDVLVSNGISGMLVQPNDADGFAIAVAGLLQDDARRIAMGSAGKKIAVEKFGFSAYCEELANFYKSLMNDHNPAK